MNDSYREYVERMAEIRRLSTPTLNEINDADEYRERLRDNFVRIGELAELNRKFLDTSFYPLMKSEENLSDERVEEMEEFGEELISPETGESLDLPIMSLLSDRLLKDAEKKGHLGSLIHLASDQIGTCYELMNMTKRIIAYPEISDHYRQRGFEMGDFFLRLLDKEKFLKEDEECREIILMNARFSVVFFEGINGDKESNEKQLDLLEKLLTVTEDPFYREAASGFDWVYARFRTLSYYAMASESCNACGFDASQLKRIQEKSKELCEYWDANKEYLEEMLEGMDDRRFLEAMYLRNTYLVGELPEEEYRDKLLEIYRGRDARDYNAASILLNLSIPSEYICLLDRESLSMDEKFILKSIYENMISYAFHMPNGETLSIMLEYFSGILEDFIEIPGGVTFENMMLQCMVAFHPPTYVHSVMVGQITECLSGHLLRLHPELFIGILNCETVEDVKARRDELLSFAYHSALCHDFGKISIIDTVFVYGRRLLDMEFDLIKTHPRTGYNLMQRSASTRAFGEVALSHHKWYDNSRGYPDDFDTSKSPLKTIIDMVLCADCLDAATDTVGRSYNKGKKLADFIGELREGSGDHYAPWLPELLSDEKTAADIEYLLLNGRQQNYRNVYYLLRNMQEREV